MLMSTDTKELRGDAPVELVSALDALALSEGMARNAYVNQVLSKHVNERLHALSTAHRMLSGNPLYPDTNRSDK